MFRRREKPSEPAHGIERLQQIVRTQMPDADPDSQALVVAVAGLLASIAYADRELHSDELAHMRTVLSRMDCLPQNGAEAVHQALTEELRAIALGNVQRHTRTLRELTDRAVRREVLDALVDLAASDGTFSLSESDLLRRTTTALGLSQDDYNEAQARHRDRLSVLDS